MPTDRPHIDRRSVLKYAGAAGATTLTALAGCSGGGGDGGGSEANHDVPHPEDSSVPSAEASGTALNGQSRSNPPQGKDAVSFQHTPSGEQHCGNCGLFVPDQDDDGFGACTLVKGKIHHCDWCNAYSPYDGDDSIPCES